MNRDITSTIAGGSAGVTLLLTVKWDGVPHGELVKIGLAVVLIVFGYFAYRNKGA